ncbi:MAG TPA: hypothetical protein VL401_00135 [Alphaproteobacteria bacterium]|nr:hypothetical protein [Alphaproteobacteria bacterium]
MKETLLQIAQRTLEEMREAAAARRSGATFEIVETTIGNHIGEIFIRKEKPTGDEVYYPVIGGETK